MEKQNYLYIYDLPKQEYSSVKLAEFLKEKTNIDLDRKPQVRRDINKPFFTAIISIADNTKFQQACEALRYFELDGKPCRGLAYDNELLGSNSQKLVDHNIFVRKIPTDISASKLEEYFSKYGDIKSLKVSLNPDHSSRGYGFVCFQAPESASAALSETKDNDSYHGVAYKPKDRREMRKAFNNIYVKNFPDEWNEDQVRELFVPYGRIESLYVSKNDKGAYAFVCFNAEDKNDREYGPKCAGDAVEGLNGKDMGNGKKLYVKEALKKSEREIEVTREALKYKNSKKRCNLYVKGFPQNTTEETLRQIFSQYGDIECLRMFPKEGAEKHYAFVCFKKPDEASSAKQELHMSTPIGDRPLVINHYEIKEYRQLVIEEAKDKQNFQQYRSQNAGPLQWSELANREELLFRLQQIMQVWPKLFNQGQKQYQGQRPAQGYNRGQRQQHQHRQQNQQMHQHPQQQQRQPIMQQPQPAMPQPMAQPSPQPGAPMPTAAPQGGPNADYYASTMNILPSVTEANPQYRQQVGTVIYNFVVSQAGPEKAPKITGMLIDLPIQEIHSYLRDFNRLCENIRGAEQLLTSQSAPAQPTPQ